MKTKNHFELRGFVGQEPEMKTTENNKLMAFLNIATEESYTNKDGEKVKNSDWHRVTLWEKKAELAEKHIKKGALVSVEGRIKPRSFVNKEGVTVYTIDFVVDVLDILSTKED